MPKTSISDLQKVQIFPGSISPDPLMYMSYTPKSNSTPIKCKKAYQIECFFGEKNNKLHLGNVSCTIDKALKVSPAVFLFKNRLLMESHLIQTMSVHCLQPFKTSIWFMFSYSFFIFSKFFSLKLSSFFFFLLIIIILQELLVKSHQLPLNQTKNEWSLIAMHCKDLK